MQVLESIIVVVKLTTVCIDNFHEIEITISIGFYPNRLVTGPPGTSTFDLKMFQWMPIYELL